MTGGSIWGTTPRQSIEAACAERGAGRVVASCIELIGGGDIDPELIASLGGPAAPRYVDAPPGRRYWLRVWGTRGLLWALGAEGAPPAGDPAVVAALVAAVADDRWRVRELGAKVIARYRVDECQPAMSVLSHDEVPRVRAAASRALRLLTT